MPVDLDNPKLARNRLALGSVLLAYLLLIVAVITLAPFRFHIPEDIQISWLVEPFDIIANVFLFMPFGFLYRLCTRTARLGRRLEVWIVGFLISSAFEFTQLFLKGRYSSPLDILSNATGAWLGALLYDRVAGGLNDRVIRRLALELPLMNIVYLLIPLLWLNGLVAGSDEGRLWLVPLLGLFGSSVLSAVWRHRLRASGILSANGLALLATLWFLMASFPSLIRAPALVIVSAIVLGTALRWQASLSSLPDPADRRFELPTLLRTCPVYAAYLFLISLWPWPWTPVTWRLVLGFASLTDTPGVISVLRLVEYLAGFTLAGYMLAEARGRLEGPLLGTTLWMLTICAASAGLLEVLRGFHPGHAASVLQLALAATAGLYGGLIYRVQLVIVRRMLDPG